MSTSGCGAGGPRGDRLSARLGCEGRPAAREELALYAGVASEVAADQPVRESFEELSPIFLRRKVSEREKHLQWSRYRGRWVAWSGKLVSFTANGATFIMLPQTTTFDVSVRFEVTARERLRGYRPGDRVEFVGRLDSFDDIWRTMYLVHGDLAPAPPRPDAGTASDGGMH